MFNLTLSIQAVRMRTELEVPVKVSEGDFDLLGVRVFGN